MLAKAEFKCLLAAAISGSEFVQNGMREVVVRRGSQRSPRGYTPCRYGGYLGANFSSFAKIISYAKGWRRDGRNV